MTWKQHTGYIIIIIFMGIGMWVFIRQERDTFWQSYIRSLPMHIDTVIQYRPVKVKTFTPPVRDTVFIPTIDSVQWKTDYLRVIEPYTTFHDDSLQFLSNDGTTWFTVPVQIVVLSLPFQRENIPSLHVSRVPLIPERVVIKEKISFLSEEQNDWWTIPVAVLSGVLIGLGIYALS